MAIRTAIDLRLCVGEKSSRDIWDRSAMSHPESLVRAPRAFARSRFLVLLVCLVGMVATLPMLSDRGRESIGADMALIAVLVSCIWSMEDRKHVTVVGCVLLVPALTAAWFASEAASPLLSITGLCCALAFTTFTSLVILRNVVEQQDVATDTILGGICVYLLFAVIWALIYQIIELVHPGSFGPWSTPSGAPGTDRLLSPELVYYSVFTLSTIGPQDVHPIGTAAQAWTGLEAMVGQLYLAVLIARLVG